MSQRERRCPACGALAGTEAEWCGQCFTSLVERPVVDEPVTLAPVPPNAGSGSGDASSSSRPDAAGGASEPIAAERGSTDAAAPDPTSVPTWRCPACETPNALELDACRVCGTTFASLMRRDEQPPAVDPRDAFVRSLAFPGLGHRAIGKGGDGLARAVLFLTALAIGAVALVSAPSVPAVASIAVLFGAIAVATYVGTAVEAARMARGGRPALSSRAVLWIIVGLLMGSVLLLSLLVIAARSSASP